MYECPNCGGDLRFDIATKKLSCAFCNAKFDPYDDIKENKAEEHEEYEVTVFTCPQCAGEIYSTDTTAAGFCSFCGAATVLESRLSKERKPKYIIPFIKTKENCKEEYRKRVKKAIYAPSELKDEKYIDSFRGIYMPYWVYDFEQKGEVMIYGDDSHRQGDYIIKDHYLIKGNLDAEFNGIPYDASSSFADDISQRLSPFDMKRAQGFTPSMLSGFYADTADVDKMLYENEAEEEVNEHTKEVVHQHPDIKMFSIKDSDNLSRQYHTTYKEAQLAMLPVWFLSSRNKNRVVYATMNGQTGKIVADLPVDIKKYLIGSAFCTLPIFVLLELFFTVKPAMVLLLALAYCLVSAIVYNKEMKDIIRKEESLDDKGMLELKKKQAKEADVYVIRDIEPDSLPVWAWVLIGLAMAMIAGIVFLVKAGYGLSGSGIQDCIFDFILVAAEGRVDKMGGFFSLIMLIPGVILSIKGMKQHKQIEATKQVSGACGALIGMIVAAIILIVNPVSDIYYYIGTSVSLVAVLFTLYDLMICYNILSTRKLPQFDYKGGDHHG